MVVVCTSLGSIREWLKRMMGRMGSGKRTKELRRHSQCLPSVASPRVTRVTKTEIISLRVAACGAFIIVISVGSPWRGSATAIEQSLGFRLHVEAGKAVLSHNAALDLSISKEQSKPCNFATKELLLEKWLSTFYILHKASWAFSRMHPAHSPAVFFNLLL